jgi:predicted MFS family arabinose efflux permease
MASSSAPRRDSRFGCLRAPRAEVLARRVSLLPTVLPFPCRYQPSRTTLLRAAQPRVGLSALAGQQLILMGTFVVISVYLQIVLGLDAFQTGTHLLALSVAMLVIALLGTRTAARRSPRTVAQLGLVAVSIGAIVMLATREWKARALRGCCFGWRVMVCGRRAPPAVRLRAGLAVGSLTPRAPRWRERAPG